MECRNIKEMIIRYSSGDIDDRERVLVDRHIRECGDCGIYFKRSQNLWGVLDSWRDIEPERQYVTRFWKKVSIEDEKAATGLIGFLKGFKPRLAISGALATVLLVGIFTFALLGPGTLERVFQSSDEKDEMILIELDRATNSETSELLAIYGPWDNSFSANGNGGMN